MPITKDVKLGENVQIYQPELVNLYGCHIGDETKIGAFVEIQEGVTIGKRVKIQAHAFIPEGVSIDDDVFIGPHVCFTNDKYPRSSQNRVLKTKKDWKLDKTIVKKGASIGANATILCGITIGEGAIIGAGSVVTEDVLPWTIVMGNPAKYVRTLSSKKST